MDYRLVYESLMHVASLTNTGAGPYEKHHIKPKCMGGNNTSDNLVRLTYRQHYVAHRLLAKFTDGEDSMRMWCALKRFTGTSAYGAEYRIKSRAYALIKEKHAQAVTALSKGRKFGPEVRARMSAAQKARFEKDRLAGKSHHTKGKIKAESTLIKMRAANTGANNPAYGKSRSEDEKRRISASMKGVQKSPEHREKLKTNLRKAIAKNPFHVKHKGYARDR